MKILFEVWGNYKKWRKVNYLFNGKNKESETSLQILYEDIKPDKVFIILSDTLIDNFVSNSKDMGYIDFIYRIKEDILNFVNNEILQKENLLVIPGVGSFEKSEFKGNPNNFFYILYYEVVKKINELLEKKSESNEKINRIDVYLDITHGINYMTLMAYRVLKEIFSIISFFYNIKFIVLNSDPVIGSNVNQVNINKIENVNLSPQFNFYKFNGYNLLLPFGEIDDTTKKEIGKQIKDIENNKKEIIDNSYVFGGSFQNALLPFIYYLFPDVNKLEEFIDKIIGFFKEKLLIENKDLNKIFIVQQVEIQPLFHSILQIFLLTKLLFKNYNIQKKYEIDKEEINSLKELFNYNRTLKMRLNKELDKIRDIMNIENEYKDYGFYVLKNEYKEEDKIDDRNLYAHCGFAYTIIQIKKVNEKIFIKIKDSVLDNIYKKISNNLLKGE